MLGGYWTVQAVVLTLAQIWLFASQAEVSPDTPLGAVPPISVFADALTEPAFMAITVGGILAMTIAQAVFVWPLRKPRLAGSRGRGIRASLAMAGLAIAALVFFGLWAIASVLDAYGFKPDHDLFFLDFPGGHLLQFGLMILPMWTIATVLLIALAEKGRREDVLARVARKILNGTIIEVALLIPLDVLIRRRDTCYCAAGTYWALTISLAIGVFALGPAIFIPLLAKRRKGWYARHCGVCGYDMAATPAAHRCPECGAGWKA